MRAVDKLDGAIFMRCSCLVIFVEFRSVLLMICVCDLSIQGKKTGKKRRARNRGANRGWQRGMRSQAAGSQNKNKNKKQSNKNVKGKSNYNKENASVARKQPGIRVDRFLLALLAITWDELKCHQGSSILALKICQYFYHAVLCKCSRLSVIYVLCDKMEETSDDIQIPHKRQIL